MDIDKLILDTFQAINLILVFGTILFGIRYQEIVREINQEQPLNGAKGLKKRKEELKNSFWIKCFPQIILFGGLLYLFLPIIVKVFQNCSFLFWNFNFLPTAFVFIYILIMVFFIWSIVLAVRILKKIKEIQ